MDTVSVAIVGLYDREVVIVGGMSQGLALFPLPENLVLSLLWTMPFICYHKTPYDRSKEE